MKKHAFFTCTLLLLGFPISNLNAQNVFSLNTSLTLPVSDFASDNRSSYGNGGATPGAGIEFQYIRQKYLRGFGLFSSLGSYINLLQNDVKKDIESWFSDEADIKHISYLNIPLSGGIYYSYDINKKIAITAHAGLLMNTLYISNFKVTQGSQTSQSTFSPVFNIGKRIGAGILINKQTSINLSYIDISETNLNGNIKHFTQLKMADGSPLKISFISLTARFRL